VAERARSDGERIEMFVGYLVNDLSQLCGGGFAETASLRPWRSTTRLRRTRADDVSFGRGSTPRRLTTRA
jgi:hypothetical protein